MNDEIKERFREILAEAQFKINSIRPGYRVLLIEAERTEADIQTDVARALQDRETIGLGASNYNFSDAPLTLDGTSREERELISRALEESCGIEAEK
jgi:hypothetical protein